MKALVKLHAEPGLWLQDVPEPEIGINDVLIRVLRTGICGTDLHICNWDAWASSTIPVPMVIGHEFVGEVVEVGSNVTDFHPGEIVSGEGHVVCGRCRNCLAGRRHLCAHTSGVGVNRPGAFAEIHRAADDEHLASPRRDRPRRGVDLRSVRQRGAHGAVVPGAGRGRADHRRRARSASWPPPSSATPARVTWSSPIVNPVPAAIWPSGWVRPSRSTPRETLAEQIQAELGMKEGLRRRPGDVGQPCGVSRHAREHGPRRARSPCSASRPERWPSTGTR